MERVWQDVLVGQGISVFRRGSIIPPRSVPIRGGTN